MSRRNGEWSVDKTRSLWFIEPDPIEPTAKRKKKSDGPKGIVVVDSEQTKSRDRYMNRFDLFLYSPFRLSMRGSNVWNVVGPKIHKKWIFILRTVCIFWQHAHSKLRPSIDNDLLDSLIRPGPIGNSNFTSNWAYRKIFRQTELMHESVTCAGDCWILILTPWMLFLCQQVFSASCAWSTGPISESCVCNSPRAD